MPRTQKQRFSDEERLSALVKGLEKYDVKWVLEGEDLVAEISAKTEQSEGTEIEVEVRDKNEKSEESGEESPKSSEESSSEPKESSTKSSETNTENNIEPKKGGIIESLEKKGKESEFDINKIKDIKRKDYTDDTRKAIFEQVFRGE